VARRLAAFIATLSVVAATSLAVRQPWASAAVAEPERTTATIVIGAAGDIACAADPNDASRPDTCQYDDTSDLIHGTGLTQVLALGDVQYDTGAYGDFLTYYDPWWGRALANTSPVPGNHEHVQDPSSKPRGYFHYFGRRVRGPAGLGYYSYDLPKGCTPGHGVCWHFVALDSELCFASGGCGPAESPGAPGPGNRQYAWLAADLAAHPNDDYACTLAYWHHPLFSFSTGSGATSAVEPLWRLLYRAHADLVLNGHSHNYERWRPQDPSGHLDRARGIREFIIGTGGASHYDLRSGPWPANLAAAQDTSFGILRIGLKSAGYTWEWVTAAGQPAFSDAKTKSVGCA
jgi:hypothetical protein